MGRQQREKRKKSKASKKKKKKAKAKDEEIPSTPSGEVASLEPSPPANPAQDSSVDVTPVITAPSTGIQEGERSPVRMSRRKTRTCKGDLSTNESIPSGDPAQTSSDELEVCTTSPLGSARIEEDDASSSRATRSVKQSSKVSPVAVPGTVCVESLDHNPSSFDLNKLSPHSNTASPVVCLERCSKSDLLACQRTQSSYEALGLSREEEDLLAAQKPMPLCRKLACVEELPSSEVVKITVKRNSPKNSEHLGKRNGCRKRISPSSIQPLDEGSCTESASSGSVADIVTGESTSLCTESGPARSQLGTPALPSARSKRSGVKRSFPGSDNDQVPCRKLLKLDSCDLGNEESMESQSVINCGHTNDILSQTSDTDLHEQENCCSFAGANDGDDEFSGSSGQCNYRVQSSFSYQSENLETQNETPLHSEYQPGDSRASASESACGSSQSLDKCGSDINLSSFEYKGDVHLDVPSDLSLKDSLVPDVMKGVPDDCSSVNTSTRSGIGQEGDTRDALRDSSLKCNSVCGDMEDIHSTVSISRENDYSHQDDPKDSLLTCSLVPGDMEGVPDDFSHVNTSRRNDFSQEECCQNDQEDPGCFGSNHSRTSVNVPLPPLVQHKEGSQLLGGGTPTKSSRKKSKSSRVKFPSERGLSCSVSPKSAISHHRFEDGREEHEGVSEDHARTEKILSKTDDSGSKLNLNRHTRIEIHCSLRHEGNSDGISLQNHCISDGIPLHLSVDVKLQRSKYEEKQIVMNSENHRNEKVSQKINRNVSNPLNSDLGSKNIVAYSGQLNEVSLELMLRRLELELSEEQLLSIVSSLGNCFSTQGATEGKEALPCREEKKQFNECAQKCSPKESGQIHVRNFNNAFEETDIGPSLAVVPGTKDSDQEGESSEVITDNKQHSTDGEVEDTGSSEQQNLGSPESYSSVRNFVHNQEAESQSDSLSNSIEPLKAVGNCYKEMDESSPSKQLSPSSPKLQGSPKMRTGSQKKSTPKRANDGYENVLTALYLVKSPRSKDDGDRSISGLQAIETPARSCSSSSENSGLNGNKVHLPESKELKKVTETNKVVEKPTTPVRKRLKRNWIVKTTETPPVSQVTSASPSTPPASTTPVPSSCSSLESSSSARDVQSTPSPSVTTSVKENTSQNETIPLAQPYTSRKSSPSSTLNLPSSECIKKVSPVPVRKGEEFPFKIPSADKPLKNVPASSKTQEVSPSSLVKTQARVSNILKINRRSTSSSSTPNSVIRPLHPRITAPQTNEEDCDDAAISLFAESADLDIEDKRNSFNPCKRPTPAVSSLSSSYAPRHNFVRRQLIEMPPAQPKPEPALEPEDMQTEMQEIKFEENNQEEEEEVEDHEEMEVYTNMVDDCEVLEGIKDDTERLLAELQSRHSEKSFIDFLICNNSEEVKLCVDTVTSRPFFTARQDSRVSAVTPAQATRVSPEMSRPPLVKHLQTNRPSPIKTVQAARPSATQTSAALSDQRNTLDIGPELIDYSVPECLTNEEEQRFFRMVNKHCFGFLKEGVCVKTSCAFRHEVPLMESSNVRTPVCETSHPRNSRKFGGVITSEFDASGRNLVAEPEAAKHELPINGLVTRFGPPRTLLEDQSCDFSSYPRNVSQMTKGQEVHDHSAGISSYNKVMLLDRASRVPPLGTPMEQETQLCPSPYSPAFSGSSSSQPHYSLSSLLQEGQGSPFSRKSAASESKSSKSTTGQLSPVQPSRDRRRMEDFEPSRADLQERLSVKSRLGATNSSPVLEESEWNPGSVWEVSPMVGERDVRKRLAGRSRDSDIRPEWKLLNIEQDPAPTIGHCSPAAAHLGLINLRQMLLNTDMMGTLNILRKFCAHDWSLTFAREVFQALKSNVQKASMQFGRLMLQSDRELNSLPLLNLLCTVGVNLMFDQMDNGLVNEAQLIYSLLKDRHIHPGAAKIFQGQMSPCRIILKCCQICINAKKYYDAKNIVLKNNLQYATPEKWKVKGIPEDSKFRVEVVRNLLAVLAKDGSSVEASNFIISIINAQPEKFAPVDIRKYSNMVMLNLLKDGHRPEATNLYWAIESESKCLEAPTYRWLLITLEQQGNMSVLADRLYGVACRMSVYPPIKWDSRPLHVKIFSYWLQEEIKVVIRDFLRKLQQGDCLKPTEDPDHLNLIVYIETLMKPQQSQMKSYPLILSQVKDSIDDAKQRLFQVLRQFRLQATSIPKDRIVQIERKSLAECLKSVI